MPRITSPVACLTATLVLAARLTATLVLAACSNSHPSTPRFDVDGGTYVAVSANGGPLLVAAHLPTGDLVTYTITADTIRFVYLSARVMETMIRSDIVGGGVYATEPMALGAWTQVGTKVILTYDQSPLSPAGSVPDTLELIAGVLHRHPTRMPCSDCPAGTSYDISYVRAFQR